MAPKPPQSILADAKKFELAGDTLGAIKLYKGFISKHRAHPSAPSVRTRTAQLCVMLGNNADAIKLIENAGVSGEQNLKMMFTLAQAYAYSGQLDNAQAALEKALHIDRDYPAGIARMATIMQFQGLNDEALAIVDDAYGRGIDTWDIDHALGELAHKAGRVDEAVERIERRLTDSDLKKVARIALESTLTTLLEKQQNYTKAWEAAARGNALNVAGGMGGYVLNTSANLDTKSVTSVQRDKERIEHIMEIFDAEMLKSLEPDESGPKQRQHLLMISGMPRSGTTLIEQILSAHPQAQSAGEAPCLKNAAINLGMLPDPSAQIVNRLSTMKRSKIGGQVLDQLRTLSGSSEFVVDKSPGNDEHIGLLAAIAPGARMILTRRDPRDIALSCFFRNFAIGHGWTNTLETIVDMIEIRLELHDHWLSVMPQAAPWIKLRVGDYQHIVNNPESQTRELVEFAGLPWNEACLDFSERKRIIPTLQPHQAAQGIYKGSLAKWVHYADCMGDQLGRLNSICERHGYEV